MDQINSLYPKLNQALTYSEFLELNKVQQEYYCEMLEKSPSYPAIEKIFQEMRAKHILRTYRHYNIAIANCVKFRFENASAIAVSVIKDITKEAIIDEDTALRPVIHNKALEICLNEPHIQRSVEIIRRMEKANIKIDPSFYIQLIDLCIWDSHVEFAFEILRSAIKAGIVVGKSTYLDYLNICEVHKNISKAFAIKKEMTNAGYTIEMDIYNGIINVCKACKNLQKALQVKDEIIKEGFSPNLKIWNNLKDLCKYDKNALEQIKGEMKNAGLKNENYKELRSNKWMDLYNKNSVQASKKKQQMLFNLQDPTDRIMLYNFTFLSVYLKDGNIKEALLIKKEMEGMFLKPDIGTYSILLQICAVKNDFETALQIKNEMLAKKITPTIHIYNQLLKFCVPKGDLENALNIREEMLENGIIPDTTILKTLIQICINCGDAERALQFEKEKKVPLKKSTCLLLFEACLPNGNVDIAMKIWEEMKNYSWTNANLTLSNAILKVCQVNGNIDLAKKIYEEMKNMHIQPDETTEGIIQQMQEPA